MPVDKLAAMCTTGAAETIGTRVAHGGDALPSLCDGVNCASCRSTHVQMWALQSIPQPAVVSNGI